MFKIKIQFRFQCTNFDFQ